MISKKSTILELKKVTNRNVLKITKKKTATLKNEIIQYYDKNGFLSWSAKKKKYIILGTNLPKDGIVECPECHTGKLLVVRSPKTRKRFIGCSNYYNGCTASSPLLQKAKLRVTKKQCEVCMWPEVIFRYSRKQKWNRNCSNINCITRQAKA
jgi:ssDNA-binding Zn-finger/Zn-ribbon topoisomerase 1